MQTLLPGDTVLAQIERFGHDGRYSKGAALPDFERIGRIIDWGTTRRDIASNPVQRQRNVLLVEEYFSSALPQNYQ